MLKSKGLDLCNVLLLEVIELFLDKVLPLQMLF
jgi:hypothetical protein